MASPTYHEKTLNVGISNAFAYKKGIGGFHDKKILVLDQDYFTKPSISSPPGIFDIGY